MQYFIITIDTEGDNLWNKPHRITTENARFLGRFQRTCEQYGFRPTYLVNYEMATCPLFKKFGREVIEAGTAEIGMHLHAWNSPPVWPLTNDDFSYQPFLIEYPVNVMREKIGFMTDLLRREFRCNVTSHRAGRWALNAEYVRILAEYGYTVDCSVTPYLSWQNTRGAPEGAGGPDYSFFPDRAYIMDFNRIECGGDGPVMEVPMTILPTMMHYGLKRIPCSKVRYLLSKATHRFFPAIVWLRPNGKNRRQMFKLINSAIEDNRDYLMFMLHSSEFMPGGSSRFDSKEKIERLYEDINALFNLATKRFKGITLSEFRVLRGN